MTAGNNELTSQAAQAREFLGRGREYLPAGDLHGASKQGSGTAAHMPKAVALARGCQYESQSHFHWVMNRARQLSISNRVLFLHGRAEVLHANFYEPELPYPLGTIQPKGGMDSSLTDYLQCKAKCSPHFP